LADCDAGLSNDEVARKFSVSASWIRCLKQRQRETGSIDPRPRRSPTSRLLAHGPRICELVQQRPDATLEELRQALGVPTSVSALCRALQLLRLNFKKKCSVPPNRTGVDNYFDDPPDRMALASGESKPWLSRRVRRIDFASRDAQNRRLGLMGEQFTLELER
jgi:transposase